MSEMALIVSESSPTAQNLWRVLVAEGMPAHVRTPLAVMADEWPAEDAPDLLLLDATLDLDTVRQLTQWIRATTDRLPAVLSFTHGDFDDLKTHIQEGLDYLVPPFLPHLVRSRLTTTRRHRDLARLVAELQATVYDGGYERELQIGREIQRGFLPERLPEISGWDIAAYFEPAREVGGDFYDAYDINGTFLGIAIADVCDKGIGAALFMALIRSLLRQAAVADDVPPDLNEAHAGGMTAKPLAGANLALRAVRTTNDYLINNHLHQAYFATLFFGVVDPRSGELIYINCGHNAPIVQRANGEQTHLPPTGPALGLMHGARFDLGQITLHLGDLLFLYTDGVPEAKNAAGEFFGEERMRDMLAEPGAAGVVVDRFTRAVTAHCGAANQFDDVTMLGLRWHSVAGEPRERDGVGQSDPCGIAI